MYYTYAPQVLHAFGNAVGPRMLPEITERVSERIGAGTVWDNLGQARTR